MGRNIGILAYGSLIDDPREEINDQVRERIKGVSTPFKVEFARSSASRDGAPTLIPVREGGANINAVILVLKEDVSESEAQNLLWRRETNQVGSGLTYVPSVEPGPNHVLIKKIENFHDVKIVLYTVIGKNIDELTPPKLAELAIKSVQSTAGIQKQDGISYLISVKRNGCNTPLMSDYEKEILSQIKVNSLEEALGKVLQNCGEDKENVLLRFYEQLNSDEGTLISNYLKDKTFESLSKSFDKLVKGQINNEIQET